MSHLLTALPALHLTATPFSSDPKTGASSGDSAWMLTSAALVLLMTPGLAFFYGGLTRAKSTLNMMMMSFVSIGVVSLLWVLYGFSIAFTDNSGHKSLFGGHHLWFLNNLGVDKGGSYILGTPDNVFVMFQLMFAIITVALISGSLADRTKFGGWVAFSILWATIVYFPVADWVFNFGVPAGTGDKVGNGVASLYKYGSGGWIVNRLGAFDFAGGTAVHINAGAAALACCLVVGKRKGWPQQIVKPHNVPSVLLGAGLLWFGWFGFNAGSALLANGTAGQAFVNTQLATAVAGLAWIGTEKIRDGHATNVGFASGAVAGLVAITPACGFVNSMGAVAIGAVAGGLCCLAVALKYRLGFDDSLDVVGVHLVGGIAGTLLIGLLATKKVNNTADGLFFGGGFSQLGKQAIAAGAVLVYSFVLSYIIAQLVDKTIGFRIKEEDELEGIDITTHAESAYDLMGSGTTGSLIAANTTSPVNPPATGPTGSTRVEV